jgi:hypothetical protein
MGAGMSDLGDALIWATLQDGSIRAQVQRSDEGRAAATTRRVVRSIHDHGPPGDLLQLIAGQVGQGVAMERELGAGELAIFVRDLLHDDLVVVDQ